MNGGRARRKGYAGSDAQNDDRGRDKRSGGRQHCRRQRRPVHGIAEMLRAQAYGARGIRCRGLVLEHVQEHPGLRQHEQ